MPWNLLKNGLGFVGKVACSRRSDSGTRKKNKASERTGEKNEGRLGKRTAEKHEPRVSSK